jgi:hypothetical protein
MAADGDTSPPVRGLTSDRNPPLAEVQTDALLDRRRFALWPRPVIVGA